MITQDNRVIPHIAIIGNHEVRDYYVYRYEDEYEQTDEVRVNRAPFYYSLIASPGQPGFGVLDFAEYLSLFLLDSGHTNPVSGYQEEWLENNLEEREHVKYKIPIYHVAAYPSVRHPEDSRIHNQIRTLWSPLFEESNVSVVFENHDHAYKRTFPIKNGQIDKNGVYYIGDGAWGVNKREVGYYHDEKMWYLDKAESVRHFIKVELSKSGIYLEMIDENGQKFDELSLDF